MEIRIADSSPWSSFSGFFHGALCHGLERSLTQCCVCSLALVDFQTWMESVHLCLVVPLTCSCHGCFLAVTMALSL